VIGLTEAARSQPLHRGLPCADAPDVAHMKTTAPPDSRLLTNALGQFTFTNLTINYGYDG